MRKKNIAIREKAATIKKHWVRLTRVCNNSCLFCLDKEAQNGSYIPLKEIEKDLNMGIKIRSRKAVLSGGEPTLHPDFLEIVRLAVNSGYKNIQVITNGRMFAYRNFLDKAVLAGISEITFSIHGHNAGLCDSQTRVRGSFEQAVTGLINALGRGDIIVNVDIVVNKKNVKCLPDIVEFFIGLGVREFDLLQVMPFGRAWDNRRQVFYDINSAYPSLEKVFMIAARPDIYIWTNRFPAQYLEGFEQLIQHSAKMYDEVNGRRVIFEDFLYRDKPIPCMGERCEYCCLKDFCRDLKEFKEKEQLTGFNCPVCIDAESYRRGNNQIITKKGITGIFNFLDFFIKYRRVVKSLRCQQCKYDKDCRGMYYEYIRKKGFKMLISVSLAEKGVDKIHVKTSVKRKVKSGK